MFSLNAPFYFYLGIIITPSFPSWLKKYFSSCIGCGSCPLQSLSVSASYRRKIDKMKSVYCQTLTEQRNTDRWITDSRVLSTLQFIEANTGGLSGKLPTLFTKQHAALLASYANCFWVICYISTLLCYIKGMTLSFENPLLRKVCPTTSIIWNVMFNKMHTLLSYSPEKTTSGLIFVSIKKR